MALVTTPKLLPSYARLGLPGLTLFGRLYDSARNWSVWDLPEFEILLQREIPVVAAGSGNDEAPEEPYV